MGHLHELYQQVIDKKMDRKEFLRQIYRERELYQQVIDKKLDRKEFLKQIYRDKEEVNIDDLDNDRSIFNIDELDNDGSTLLLKVLLNNDLDLAISLLAFNPDIHLLNNFNMSPAKLALIKMNEELLMAMTLHGLDIDEPANSGYTALYSEVKAGDVKTVEMLLRVGADVKKSNFSGESILQATLKSESANKNVILKSLFLYGIGIGQRFSAITLPQGLTDNCIVIGATLNRQPITRQTPGFAQAITTFEEFKAVIAANEKLKAEALANKEFKAAVVAEVQFNYKELYRVTKHLIRQSRGMRNNALIQKLAPLKAELKKLWHAQEQMRVKPLTELIARSLVDTKGNLNFFNDLRQKKLLLNFPQTLVEKVEARHTYQKQKAQSLLTRSDKSRFFLPASKENSDSSNEEENKDSSKAPSETLSVIESSNDHPKNELASTTKVDVSDVKKP